MNAVPVKLRAACGAADMDAARRLFLDYATSLGFSLCFQNFDEEMAALPGKYAPPAGEILLAEADGEAVGVVALRKLEAGLCEMKRLYVAPLQRGTGLGGRLARAIIEAARAKGYGAMRLDTLESMGSAIALYHHLGFVEIAPYYNNPLPGARYFELPLPARDGGKDIFSARAAK
jgi:ribosomal protein S18 acetylase RimI-like enzyme